MKIKTSRPSSFWDSKTKLLHMGLAVLVTFELFVTLVMREPGPGWPLQGFASAMFEMHEWVGMAALAIVLLHWAWSLWKRVARASVICSHGRAWSARRSGESCAAWCPYGYPPGVPEGRLSGLVHGLGFLAVTAVALTGGVLFLAMPEDGGNLTPLTSAAEEMREVVAVFVWIYWCGHVALALLHELPAHDGTVRRMFRPTEV